MTRTARTALPLSLLAALLGCEARSAASVSPLAASEAGVVGTPELMVEAEPSPAEVRELDPDLLAFAFVVEIDGRSHVVLSGEADPSWGVGPLRELVPSTYAHVAVGMQVALDRMPSGLARQLGREVTLYDAAGTRCSSRLGSPLLVAQYGYGIEGLGLPSWDEVTQDTIEYTPAQLAEAVWATQSQWLVAEIDDTCGALWARDAALPAPDILHHSDDPNPLADAYAQAFRSSSIVPDMRDSYEAEIAGNPDAEPWPRRMSGAEVEVSSWLDTRGRVRFLELDYGFDDASCGWGYDTEYREFSEVVDDELVEIAAEPDAIAILDVDLDGRYEMIYASDQEGASLSLHGDTLGIHLGIDADFMCPC